MLCSSRGHRCLPPSGGCLGNYLSQSLAFLQFVHISQFLPMSLSLLFGTQDDMGRYHVVTGNQTRELPQTLVVYVGKNATSTLHTENCDYIGQTFSRGNFSIAVLEWARYFSLYIMHVQYRASSVCHIAAYICVCISLQVYTPYGLGNRLSSRPRLKVSLVYRVMAVDFV